MNPRELLKKLLRSDKKRDRQRAIIAGMYEGKAPYTKEELENQKDKYLINQRYLERND